MRIGTKAHRALQLLLGLRNARVAAALAAHGFTDQDLQQGWDLLQALGKTRVEAAVDASDPQTIQALNRWENFGFRWPMPRSPVAFRPPTLGCS